MALIALGVTGGDRRLQGRRGRARPAEAGPRGRRRDDRAAAPVRRAADVRGDHPAARSSPTSSSRAPTPTSSTSRSRRPSTLLLVAPATAERHRQVRQRHRRRLPVVAVPRHAAPVLMAPAMNTQCSRTRRCAEPRHAGRARRPVRRAGRGLPGVRLDRQGPARRAGRRSSTAADALLRPDGPLRGRRVLVTAGPTCEDLDPVRYLGNRSSGRMGFARGGRGARAAAPR